MSEAPPSGGVASTPDWSFLTGERWPILYKAFGAPALEETRRGDQVWAAFSEFRDVVLEDVV